ncbi:MAG TPA: c-type cytochrome biogenesis protein CcsB [Bacillota bacterium]|jgi:cytochrome c-type biogenesis protein CcsB
MTQASGGLYVLTLILYAASAATYFGFLYWRHWERAAAWTGRLALTVHTLTIAARVAESGRPPFVYLFEATLFFTWLLMLNYTLLEAILGLKVAGVFVTPVTFILLFAAAAMPKEAAAFDPTLSGAWVAVHLSLSILAYAAFTMAFVLTLMYLLQERQLRAKAFRLIFRRLPSLEILDTWSHRLIDVGFALLTLGIISGSIWAGYAWGSHWSWDPKETFSILTWALYGVYLILRARFGWNGRKAAYLSLAAYAMVLANFFVVNLFLNSLHRRL